MKKIIAKVLTIVCYFLITFCSLVALGTIGIGALSAEIAIILAIITFSYLTLTAFINMISEMSRLMEIIEKEKAKK